MKIAFKLNPRPVNSFASCRNRIFFIAIGVLSDFLYQRFFWSCQNKMRCIWPVSLFFLSKAKKNFNRSRKVNSEKFYDISSRLVDFLILQIVKDRGITTERLRDAGSKSQLNFLLLLLKHRGCQTTRDFQVNGSRVYQLRGSRPTDSIYL